MTDLIRHEDIEVRPWPNRPHGGQHVGVISGVRIEHVTGIVVCVNTDRSQHRNRQIAIHALEGALTSPAMRG